MNVRVLSRGGGWRGSMVSVLLATCLVGGAAHAQAPTSAPASAPVRPSWMGAADQLDNALHGGASQTDRKQLTPKRPPLVSPGVQPTRAAKKRGAPIDAFSDFTELELKALLEIDVVTASKEKQKALDAPAGMSVVTAAMIRDRGYTSLTELLDDIPGVEIQRKSVAEYRNYISLRGVQGNDRFIILMDGFRVSSCVNSPMVVGTNYPLVDVKQVEIILGPASALYGADALSGVINIITKSGAELSGGSARASYGMYNTTDNSLVVGRRLHDKVALSVAAHLYHSDEPFLPNKYPKEFRWYNARYSRTGDVRQSAQLPNNIINLGEPRPYATPTDSYWVHSRLSAGDFEFSYMRSQEAHSSSFSGKPEYNLYVEDALFKTIIESISAAHRYTSSGGRVSLRTSLSRGYFEIHPDTKFVNQFTNFKDGWKYEYGRSIKAEEQITVRLGEQTVLTGGLSYEDIASLPKTGDLPNRFDKDRPADLQQQHIPGTNIQDKDGNDLTVPSDFYYLEYQNIGTYLQLRTQLWGLVEPTLGARLDYNTRYGWTFNPRMGVVVSPLRSLKLKLLYGEAFLAPSPYNAYQHYGAFIPTKDSSGADTGLTGPFWHLSNPELDPEKLRSVEAWIHYYLLDQLAVSLNGFYISHENVIVFQSEKYNAATNTPSFKGWPVAFSERPVNKGSAYMAGGTLRVDTVLRPAPLRLLRLYAAYTYTGGEIDGKPLTYTAPHAVKAGIDISWRKLTVSTRLIYRSRTLHQLYHRAGNDAQLDTFSSRPYLVANLFARYSNIFCTNNYRLSAYLKVLNLSNARYYNVSLATEEGFPATPQDPIRVMGGLIVDFEL
jgi:outer membrane receptor for ferrienterochelin and colicin